MFASHTKLICMILSNSCCPPRLESVILTPQTGLTIDFQPASQNQYVDNTKLSKQEIALILTCL